MVEGFAEVADCLVIDTGELGAARARLRAVLVLAAGRVLDDAMAGRSGRRCAPSCRRGTSPDEIHQVPGIPRTLYGKKLEVPVRKILLGTPLAQAADPDSLANPEVLAHFVPQDPQ